MSSRKAEIYRLQQESKTIPKKIDILPWKMTAGSNAFQTRAKIVSIL
jgi:hypothetical protein